MVLESIFPASPLTSWFVLLVITALSLYALFVRESRVYKMCSKIPGPPQLPIFGNVLQLNVANDKILNVLKDWAGKYGKRVFMRLGSFHYVVIMDRFDTEKVLNSQVHINKSRDYDFIMSWLGTGLLTSRGDKWFHRRKLLTPTFHFRILDDFLEVFNEQAHTLTQILTKEFGDGKVFDIFPYVTRCALDIISETAMGQKINAQQQRDTEYVRAIYRISELIQHRQIRPWLQPDFLWKLSPSGKEEKACLKILHDFTDRVIRERKTEFLQKKRSQSQESEPVNTEDVFTKGKTRLAFLDLLVEAQAKEEGGAAALRLTDKDIREETDTFMFEGHDTTAANANWTIFLLACHPEYQQKVQEELDSIFGDDRERHVTNQDMTQMKYLECCIKESLRLYPSVPFFARSIETDLKLDDKVTIPSGATAFLIPYQLHRDPEVFSDPEVFRPDRFFPDNAMGRHPFSYVPFSAGPRNCIGQKFAMMEEKVIISQFFRNFTVTAAEKREDLLLLAELIMRPKDGLHVKITPRK